MLIHGAARRPRRFPHGAARRPRRFVRHRAVRRDCPVS
ncbi:hypothetical protein BN940_04221 [Castellaniella defragrans 65Phen]|uniref:Uncharacterized protein n=1 Tax=Castellaniella defragrans (strain DSM 12143 / CCUG 39792 / 65Phen) TaxID=1437824 RepID=W8WUE1_CASD6|nr:hypothetical protein BN940_04221 [Castellaniella defragrans 65Phen]